MFLRNIVFLTTATDPSTFVIVHEWGMPQKGRWEPPKGQMEWKEFQDANVKPGSVVSKSQLATHMRKAALREMIEESYILPKDVDNFRMLPLSYRQDWPESGLPGVQFMYVYWAGTIKKPVVTHARKRILEVVRNPEWKAVLPPDLCEKDDMMWWNPTDGWDTIRTGFSKKMTRMYIEYITKYGI